MRDAVEMMYSYSFRCRMSSSVTDSNLLMHDTPSF